jgi:hypothetical protein
MSARESLIRGDRLTNSILELTVPSNSRKQTVNASETSANGALQCLRVDDAMEKRNTEGNECEGSSGGIESNISKWSDARQSGHSRMASRRS